MNKVRKDLDKMGSALKKVRNPMFTSGSRGKKKRWGQKKFIGENNPYQSDLAATRNEVIIPAAAVGVGTDYFLDKNQQSFIDSGQHAQNQAQGERQYKGYAKHYLKSKIKQIGKLFQ